MSLIIFAMIYFLSGCASTPGNQLIFQAITLHDRDAVRQLLDDGLDVNEPVGAGRFPPLVYASQLGDADMVRFLVEKGAKINGADLSGRNSLTSAANENVAKFLIDSGADVNYQTSGGYTPLMQAARYGTPAWVKMLIDKGASIVSRTDMGYNHLHWAATTNNISVARLFLEKGVDVNAVSTSGSTPLLISVDSSWYLDEGGVLRSAYSAESSLILKRKRLEFVNFLLERGAEVGLRDGAGKTAREIALDRHHSELSDVLNAAEASGPTVQTDPDFEKLIENGRLSAIKAYLDKKPKSIRFVKDESMRLRLVGPAGLRVDDLLALTQAKQKDALVIAQMQANGGTYKKFEPAEVVALQKMGMPDDVIAAMISLTVDREKARGGTTPSVPSSALVPVARQAVAPAGSVEEEKSEDCVQLALALKACERSSGLIPFGGALIAEGCKSTARSNYNCSIPIERLIR